MADEADMTGEREELERAVWEKKRQAEAAKPKNTAKECVECGEEIPSARQVAAGGTELCTFHAQVAETKRKHYR